MNPSSLVLVDSSVWVHFFKYSEASILTDLIAENLACTNELILTELIPFAHYKKQQGLIEGLLAVEIIPLAIDWEGIRMLQITNLQNGINHVGIPDLIIAQQALEYKMQLWSTDKHFELMADIIELNVFSP